MPEWFNGYKVAWGKIKRRIWNISPRTDNNLVSNVTDNLDTLIETRMVRFIFNSINHSNNTCKKILRVKLLSVKLSTLRLLLIINIYHTSMIQWKLIGSHH